MLERALDSRRDMWRSRNIFWANRRPCSLSAARSDESSRRRSTAAASCLTLPGGTGNAALLVVASRAASPAAATITGVPVAQQSKSLDGTNEANVGSAASGTRSASDARMKSTATWAGTWERNSSGDSFAACSSSEAFAAPSPTRSNLKPVPRRSAAATAVSRPCARPRLPANVHTKRSSGKPYGAPVYLRSAAFSHNGVVPLGISATSLL